jgi:hypothetical protein
MISSFSMRELVLNVEKLTFFNSPPFAIVCIEGHITRICTYTLLGIRHLASLSSRSLAVNEYTAMEAETMPPFKCVDRLHNHLALFPSMPTEALKHPYIPLIE